jgi:CheY-like chemotaxis protein
VTPDPSSPEPLPRLRILVVDDEDGIRDLLAQWLRREGHTVSCAANGREATTLLTSQRFDLLITDVVMPERDGFEVIAELRKHQPHARILATSGGGRYLSGGDCLMVAKRLGAHAVVMKPFDRAQLIAAIQAALEGTGSRG